MSSFGSSFAAAYNAAASKKNAGRANDIASDRNALAWAALAEQQEERDQRASDAGKAAEYFFKANPAALMELGISETAFANMSAAEQSSAAMGYVQGQAQKQVMQQLAQQQQAMGDDTAAQTAFQRAAQGSVTMPNPVAPGLFPDRTVQTVGQPTTAEVWRQLAQDPRALRSALARPFLQQLAQPAGGAPLIMAGPFPGTKIVTDHRGLGTPQVVMDPSAKTELTDYQRAQLVSKARNNWVNAKRMVDYLSTDKDERSASMLPGAQAEMQAAEEELRALGVALPSNSGSSTNKVRRYNPATGKIE